MAKGVDPVKTPPSELRPKVTLSAKGDISDLEQRAVRIWLDNLPNQSADQIVGPRRLQLFRDCFAVTC